MKKYALIVAGGVGKRMGSSVPKQFIPIAGQPILMHTLTAFYRYDHKMEIILVLPHSHFNQWTELSLKYDFDIPHRLVGGGSSRFHSVKNGLDTIEEGVVAIHDGVRPLVSTDIISASFELAAEKGNAVVAVDLKDSLREMSKNSSKAVDRNRFKIIQTPQTFLVAPLKKAYQVTYTDAITDDASVAEMAGQKINLIEGSYNNLKITTREDIAVAEALLERKQKNPER